MVYEEDKTFKVTDTLITLVSFKRGGVGLVLLGVDCLQTGSNGKSRSCFFNQSMKR